MCVCVCFFSPQLILKFTEGVQWFYYREKLYFSKDPKGAQHFSGVQLFPGGLGGLNANFYRNPHNL